MAADDRLYDLLMALFRKETELERFLVLEGYPLAELLPRVEALTLSHAAKSTAEGLLQRGLVDERLFAALRKRSPERAADIDAVATQLLTPPARPEVAGSTNLPDWWDEGPARRSIVDDSTDDELGAFARWLRAAPDLPEEPDPTLEALSPTRWGWTGAAAVLGSFRPGELVPLPGMAPPEPALVALAAPVHTAADGRWVLEDELRGTALRRLSDEHRLDDALAVNSELDDPRRDALRLLQETTPSYRPVSLFEMDGPGLADLDVACGWLERAGLATPIPRAEVRAAIERRRLIDPLRALVGTTFRGRAAQLDQLRRHIWDADPQPVLRLLGPGGCGKSTLLGRLLLDFEERISEGPVVPFVYLDFDRARNDPRDPAGLIEQIARQLRLMFASAEEAARFAALESFSGGTDAGQVADILQVDPDSGAAAMLNALADQLRHVRSLGAVDLHGPSLVLVLDTFEEVQVRGPGAVGDLLAVVDSLREALPDSKVVLAGRSVPATVGGPLVELGDLDPDAADAVLTARGVLDPALRETIIERFGRDPLTLRLASEALKRLGSAGRAFDGVLAEVDVTAEVAREQVQGVLYGRILGHLRDPEVVRVAHPGLAVRRITVDVLRDVLAVPCELDPNRAEIIFERLGRQADMFEPEDDDTLRHRDDVRRLMLRMARLDPVLSKKVAEIHTRAVAFYAPRPGDPARAEELYHRLMAGEHPRGLDLLWYAALKVGRLPALDEPLPSRAAGWLRRRLGLDPFDRNEWDQEDWEAEAARRVESWLLSRDPARALAVLDERTARQPGSRLPALEVAAATAAGLLTRAAAALNAGLSGCGEDPVAQLDLMEQAIVLYGRQGDAPRVLDAAYAALPLGDLAGTPLRALDVGARALDVLPADAAQRESLLDALAGRFLRLSIERLNGGFLQVCHVLRSVGPSRPAVLLHAAASDDPVFLRDARALVRLLRGTAPSAESALAALGSAIGARQNIEDLVSLALRVNRTDDLIRIGIEHAADPVAAARLVATELVPQAEEEPDAIPLPGRDHA